MDSVALVKYCGDLEKTLIRAISLNGGFGVLKSPVVIKPNICAQVDETGVANTKVEIVEALIEVILKEYEDVSIRIVESDSESKYADEAFEKFGYKSIEERFRSRGFDLSLVNLSRSPTVKVKLNGLYFENPELPQLLTESRYFISIAVAKTHSLTLITGAMKNLFGLLPRKDQSFYHPNINEVIIDLNSFIRPDLCIIDAIVGLEGVLRGRPRRVDMLIVGGKPVSVDATMARVMGFEPERIRHLVCAESQHLGSIHPKVLGASLESAAVEFKQPANLRQTAFIN